jgi:hypothetical protein
MASMNGRAIVRFVLALIAVGLLIGVGVEIYQSGVQQGIVDAGRVPAGAAVPYVGYGYHPGFGFGFLGFLFPLLFIFLIFGLVRAAFWGGRGHRGWGGRGWGGYGYGPGGPGSDPSGWQAERDRRIAEMHQRLHDAGATGASPSGGSAPGSSAGGSNAGTTGGSDQSV